MFVCCVTYYQGFELQVVDDETNEPIPNIVVYHQVQKIKPVYFIESESESVIQEKLTTDENGIVNIKGKMIRLGFWEFITDEDLYINVSSTKGNDIGETIDNLDGFFTGFKVSYDYHGIFSPNQQYNSINMWNSIIGQGKIIVPQGDVFIEEPLGYRMGRKPKRIIFRLVKRERL